MRTKKMMKTMKTTMIMMMHHGGAWALTSGELDQGEDGPLRLQKSPFITKMRMKMLNLWRCQCTAQKTLKNPKRGGAVWTLQGIASLLQKPTDLFLVKKPIHPRRVWTAFRRTGEGPLKSKDPLGTEAAPRQTPARPPRPCLVPWTTS